MNILEYLDIRNQRRHLRWLINHHNKEVSRYCEVYGQCGTADLKKYCYKVIKEHKAKAEYYTNELMKKLV